MSHKLIKNIVDSRLQFGEHLAINELIRLNTSAGKKLPEKPNQMFYPYDLVFSKLYKDLEKYL